MKIDPWLLPDGVEEVLPVEALVVEKLRRDLLDLYKSWGYELIIPPLLEFTDSLLSGVGGDLNLLTLKVTDQLSGQLMGLRADITPQAARIDAHSYVKKGPNRLCYIDHVLHARPKSPLAVRTPLQVGVELFGETGLAGDIEVISLLLASLQEVGMAVGGEQAGERKVTLGLGHTGLCRALLGGFKLSCHQENEFLDLLQTKDEAEINHWIRCNLDSAQAASWLSCLSGLCGDASILEVACEQLAGAPTEALAAIDELATVSALLNQRCSRVNLYFDLGEFRGYDYHTGIVFAAYVDGFGDAIASGGRYDHIGEVYGRARPATGFGFNLTSVLPLLSVTEELSGIYAPPTDDPDQWQAVQALRRQGERVVCGLSEQPPDLQELRCDRLLVLDEGQYRVQSVSL